MVRTRDTNPRSSAQRAGCCSLNPREAEPCCTSSASDIRSAAAHEPTSSDASASSSRDGSTSRSEPARSSSRA